MARIAPRTREIEPAQRHGDLAADTERFAGLLLAVLRGVEVVGRAGLPPPALIDMADTALAVLPRPHGRGDGA
ncbi:hypothetical protein [Actinoplanes sp. NPDC020271]|uniref:hypothetical protein n=1 Tax=Actinoplanes sp. NPDC020271 TaxID=3363896 RepID=UPI0037A641DA